MPNTENQVSELTLNSPRSWLLASRPKTLTAAAVPVMIAVMFAYKDTLSHGLSFCLPAALCFLFAFAMQVDANFINDYFDFIRGRDDRSTRLGPPRACAEGWVSLKAMRLAIAITTTAAALIGLPLAWFGGWPMVAVGAACILFCFLYTTFFSECGLGDVLVLVFFGLVPVCCTYCLLTGSLSWYVVVISVANGLVTDTLLVVNNFRDRDTDRAVGKRTLVVWLGERASLRLYLGLGLVASALALSLIAAQYVAAALAQLLYIYFHWKTYRQIKLIRSGRELNTCLAATSANILKFGLLVSLGALLC